MHSLIAWSCEHWGQILDDSTSFVCHVLVLVFIEFPELICQHQAAYIQKTKQKVATMGTMRQMPLQQHGMFGRD